MENTVQSTKGHSVSTKYPTKMRRSSPLLEGFRDGFPIGLGYFAVSFSLGITAKIAGITPLQGFLASLFTDASAGEYVVFTMIAAGTTWLEIILITIITNARYLLMSCALSQRIDPDAPFYQRFLMGFGVTDEIFGISIAREHDLSPLYTFGAILFAGPCWATGTALGIIAGQLLPLRAVSALSVALYGMFLSTIIPAAKKSHIIAGIVAVSALCSLASDYLPVISAFSSGTKTILLTLVISAAAAILFPVKQEENETAPLKQEESEASHE